MDSDNWVQVVLGLLGLGITITLTLIGIIFSWIRARIEKNEERFSRDMSELRQQMLERLRTLGHEDREIRSQIDGLMKLFIDDVRNRKEK